MLSIPSLVRRGLRAFATCSLLSGIALFAGACGDDISPVVSCSTAAECPVPLGMVTVECCGGNCVVATSGCDSGFRYVTSEPDVGGCVAQIPATCGGGHDMSVLEDMSKPEEDAGP